MKKMWRVRWGHLISGVLNFGDLKMECCYTDSDLYATVEREREREI